MSAVLDGEQIVSLADLLAANSGKEEGISGERFIAGDGGLA